MSVIIKFGGTSLDTPEHRRQAVEKVGTLYAQTPQITVVVSAMGRKGEPYATDTLLSAVGKATPQTRDFGACAGEILSCAMMASALQAVGIPAMPMTGGQAGIRTDRTFGSAQVIEVDAGPQRAAWQAGQVPVVCGFQGQTGQGELTTLGRGGSDTTAAWLAAAVQAQQIVIVTDVAGVRRGDPRWLKDAPRIPMLSMAQMQAMAENGAKVVHPGAVQVARVSGIPMVICTANGEEGETQIVPEAPLTGAMAALSGWARIETEHETLTVADAQAETVAETLSRRGERVSLIRDLTRLTVWGLDAEQAAQLLRQIEVPCMAAEMMPGGCILWLWDYDLCAAAETLCEHLA